MEGVTVLNRIDIVGGPVWFVWAIIGLVFVGALCLAVGISKPYEWYSVAAGVMAILCVLGIFILIIISDEIQKPTGRYQYEVIIDDTVSVTELYEKYEVVEQRGEIWVLKDKEVNEE